MKHNNINLYLATLPKGSGKRWAATIDYVEKEGIEITVYAIRYRNCDKTPKSKIAFIESETRYRVNSDFYYTTMGGYNMLWERRRNTYTYWGDVDVRDELWEMEIKQAPKIGSVEYLFDEDNIHQLMPETKYLTEMPLPEIIKFIKLWKQYPEVELVYKNKKTRNKWADTRIYKMSKQRKRQILPLLNEGMSVNDAEGTIKYGSNIEIEREKNRHVRTVTKYFKSEKELENLKLSKKMKLTIYKFVETKANNDWSGYIDYLVASGQLNRNIASYGVLCPNSFQEQHDNAIRILKEREERKLRRSKKRIDSRVKAKAKLFMEMYGELVENVSQYGLELKVANSCDFLVDVGNSLEICVGVCGYDKKIADGKSVIMVVMKKDKPIECCELIPTKDKKSYQIAQLRGYANHDSKYHKKAETMINNFISQQQQLQRQEQL